MIAEKVYVVKSDFIIYRRGGQVRAVVIPPAPKQQVTTLANRPLVINGQVAR